MRRHQREIHGITTYLINSKSKSSVKKSVRRCTQTEAVSAAKQANIPTATLPPLPYTTMDDPISMSNHIQADLGCLGSNETVFDHTETAAHLFTYMPTSNRPYSSLEEPTIGTDVDATLDEDLTCRCTVSARLTGVGRCRYCREVEEVEWMFGVIARKREKRRNAGLDQTPPAEQNFCGFCGCHKRDIESSDVEARCDCGDSFPLDLGPSTRRR